MTRPFEGFAAEVLESIPAADRKRPIAWKHMAAVCEAVLSIAAEKNAALEQRVAALEAKQAKGAKPVVRLPARMQRVAA